MGFYYGFYFVSLNIEEITGFLLVISCELGKTDNIGKDYGS
jgi:hypothetical protein